MRDWGSGCGLSSRKELKYSIHCVPWLGEEEEEEEKEEEEEEEEEGTS